MEAHRPKREAIQKFIGHETQRFKNWVIRAIDEAENPIIVLQAHRDDKREGASEKTLEIHTRQVRLEDGDLDETTKTMILRWLASLLALPASSRRHCQAQSLLGESHWYPSLGHGWPAVQAYT